jgi:hypothetical protein
MTHIKDQDPSEIREKAHFFNSELYKSRTSWEWYSLQELKIRFNLTFDDSEIRVGGERSEIKKSNLYYSWLEVAIGRCICVKERIALTDMAPDGSYALIKSSLDLVDYLHDEGLHKIAHHLDYLTCNLAVQIGYKNNALEQAA